MILVDLIKKSDTEITPTVETTINYNSAVLSLCVVIVYCLLTSKAIGHLQKYPWGTLAPLVKES